MDIQNALKKLAEMACHDESGGEDRAARLLAGDNIAQECFMENWRMIQQWHDSVYLVAQTEGLLEWMGEAEVSSFTFGYDEYDDDTVHFVFSGPGGERAEIDGLRDYVDTGLLCSLLPSNKNTEASQGVPGLLRMMYKDELAADYEKELISKGMVLGTDGQKSSAEKVSGRTPPRL